MKLHTVSALERKQSQLMEAIHLQDLQTVCELLEDGVNPDWMTDAGNTPLHLAALNCNRSSFYLELAEYLLLFGADPNRPNRNEETPILLAAYRNHRAMVSLLLENRANPNIATKGGYLALRLATDPEVKQMLIAHGAVSEGIPSGQEEQKGEKPKPAAKKREVFTLSQYDGSFYPTVQTFEEEYLRHTIALVKKKMGYMEIFEESSRGSKDWSEYIVRRHFAASAGLLKSTLANPYFGRIDVERKGTKESLYIGKNGVEDDADQRLWVVNWTSPIAKLYYQRHLGKSTDDVLGDYHLHLVRTITIEHGQIHSIHTQTAGVGYVDPLLESVLTNRKAKAAMEDIVATIQAEQDTIIRLRRNQPLLIQGSAGSGKTTIALHRLAYLFYNHPEIEPEQMVIFGPSKLFMTYIANVLPGLGVNGIRQTSFEEWAFPLLQQKEKRLRLTADIRDAELPEDDPSRPARNALLRCKGSLSFDQRLRAFLQQFEQELALPDEIACSTTRFRFAFGQIKRRFAVEYSYLPIQARGEKLAQLYEKQLDDYRKKELEQVEQELLLIADRQERMRKQEEYKAEKQALETGLAAQWKALADILGGISLLSLYDAFLATESPEMFTETRQLLENGMITSADLAPLLCIYHFLYGDISLSTEKGPCKYVVIDEAQDFSPFQLAIVARHLCSDQAIMLLGDLGQSIHEGRGIERWGDFAEVFSQKPVTIELSTSYRSTIPITSFANAILQPYSEAMQFGLSQPLLREGRQPVLKGFANNWEIIDAIRETWTDCRKRGLGHVAIITKTTEQARVVHTALADSEITLIEKPDDTYDGGAVVLPVALAKGLEFDVVIVCNATDYNYPANDRNRKLLYVACTRALHELYLYYKGNRSPLLADGVTG